MRLSKLLTMLLCGCLLLSFAACTVMPDTNDPTEQTSSEITTSPDQTTNAPNTEGTTTEGTEPPVDEPQDAIEAKKEALNTIKQSIGATTDTVLYVKDFGAVGDGKTDDGAAIFEAVTAAAAQHATLMFEQDKTYYVASAPGGRVTPFALSGAHGLSIDGNNSTILISPNMRYINFSGCGNIKMTNLHFDYAVSVYLVGTVTAVNDNDVTFSLDQNPYVDNYDFTNVNGFSILYNEGIQSRPHMFMGKAIKTADKEMTVTYTKSHHYKVGNVVFLPNPGVGHAANEVMYVGGSEQPMLFENIGVHAASTFIWAVNGSKADIFFENVDLVPAESNQREIKMVSWRDGYHCKDNAAGIHWNNCEADVLFDDVFNIANTLGVVTSADSNTSFNVKNYENGAFFHCNPGDTIDIYNLTEGTYQGSARVRAINDNADGSRTLILYYGQSINNVKSGCVVANRDTGAPGSTITNCHFQGTFRFLRNLYVENTVFDALQHWMMVEGSVEGPLPGNVDFVGCTFNSGSVQIDALNRVNGKRMKEIGSRIVDIGFWDCTFTNRSEVTSRTGADFTISESYTVDDLFTVKNSATNNDPQAITPTKGDVALGVTYDWTLFTMPFTGTSAVIPLSSMQDKALADILNVENVGDNVLQLTATAGEKLFFDGLSASAVPFLYDKNTSYILKLTYYTETPVKASLVIGDRVVTDNLFAESGKVAATSLIYVSAGSGKNVHILYEGNGTVYLGELTVAAFVNVNPSISQLEQGHTFMWNDQAQIKGGSVLNVADITNETAKNAILGAPDKFSNAVMLLGREVGDFTGITKKSYFTSGTTYHISIDAYIATPLPAGTTMYLLAMDSTPGNRVLKEGVFTGEGMYHFEMDWQVGSTGEYQLKFFFNNTPTTAPEIYVGNFTLTKMPGMNPNKTFVPGNMAAPTVDQLKQGFTFDFAEGVFFETTKNTYVDASCLNEYTKQTLAKAGFGEYAYYFNENFDGIALANPLQGGQKYIISFKVYDCKGNLDDNARGAFVLLNMTGGGQNSAECNYKITADPDHPGVYTITFTDTPPTGTDTLRFYQIEACEFYIASVTVKVG